MAGGEGTSNGTAAANPGPSGLTHVVGGASGNIRMDTLLGELLMRIGGVDSKTAQEQGIKQRSSPEPQLIESSNNTDDGGEGGLPNFKYKGSTPCGEESSSKPKADDILLAERSQKSGITNASTTNREKTGFDLLPTLEQIEQLCGELVEAIKSKMTLNKASLGRKLEEKIGLLDRMRRTKEEELLTVVKFQTSLEFSRELLKFMTKYENAGKGLMTSAELKEFMETLLAKPAQEVEHCRIGEALIKSIKMVGNMCEIHRRQPADAVGQTPNEFKRKLVDANASLRKEERISKVRVTATSSGSPIPRIIGQNRKSQSVIKAPPSILTNHHQGLSTTADSADTTTTRGESIKGNCSQGQNSSQFVDMLKQMAGVAADAELQSKTSRNKNPRKSVNARKTQATNKSTQFQNVSANKGSSSSCGNLSGGQYASLSSVVEAVCTSTTQNQNPVKQEEHAARAPGICSHCHLQNANFVCGACHGEWYCSRECQSAKWDEHMPKCPSTAD